MKSKEKFIENFKLSLANISISCEASGISRQTYYNWRNGDKEFRESCKDIEERNLDLAEMKLLNAIREGKTAELIFYLKTKGKKRGYVERQEITGIDGQKLFEVRIIDTIPLLEDSDETTELENIESTPHEQSLQTPPDGQE